MANRSVKKSREQIIVFAYDTEYCQHESDDPQKAVLFFHPNWVNEQQRLALCGQLMGVTHFCSTVFSTPNVLSLQSGKFLIKKFARYILSVGSDQSLPDWILEERFKALQFVIEFYHCDLYTIFSCADQDHELFVQKLAQVLEGYVPVLKNAVTSVGSVPSLQYQNSNSTVFLEAYQLLEAAKAQEGVAGGLILHNGMVVVSQLSANLNLLACLTDPFRFQSSGKIVSVPFHLPVGVQLFKVYVKSSLLKTLIKKTANKAAAPRSRKERKEVNKEAGTKIFTVPEEDAVTADVILKESAYMKLKNRRNSKQKTESNSLKERSKSYRANPNISVCSTPTVEKKFIHEEVVSICSGKIDPKLPPVPDLVQDVLNAKPTNSAKTQQYTSLRRISMDDQMIDLSQKTYPVPLKYYSFGLPRLSKPVVDNSLIRKGIYKTLTDPLYPVFRDDGLPVSKGLYNQCLDEHYKDYLTANQTIDTQEAYIKTRQLEKEQKVEPKLVEPVKPVEKKIDQKKFRRSLTLPVKPMTLDFDKQSHGKSKIVHGATPTTPLMNKLSLLALEEQDQTNAEEKLELPPPSCMRRTDGYAAQEDARKARRKKEEEDDKNATLVPCTLFVCGHKNMTLFLILEENAEQNPDLVLSLWEMASKNLDRIESIWDKSMDHVTQNGAGGSSSYSFLTLEPTWGTLRKYGAWGDDELRLVGSLHQDMLHYSNITEMIARNEESVVYGYRCGRTETYYQQSGSPCVGLPTPADLMGVIPLKARRRLERDHGIILL